MHCLLANNNNNNIARFTGSGHSNNSTLDFRRYRVRCLSSLSRSASWCSSLHFNEKPRRRKQPLLKPLISGNLNFIVIVWKLQENGNIYSSKRKEANNYRNEVCGIRAQTGAMVESQPRDPGSGKPWDRDQQYFSGSGIRLYHFCGTGDQNLSRFWNQGSEIWVQKCDRSATIRMFWTPGLRPLLTP